MTVNLFGNAPASPTQSVPGAPAQGNSPDGVFAGLFAALLPTTSPTGSGQGATGQKTANPAVNPGDAAQDSATGDAGDSQTASVFTPISLVFGKTSGNGSLGKALNGRAAAKKTDSPDSGAITAPGALTVLASNSDPALAAVAAALDAGASKPPESAGNADLPASLTQSDAPAASPQSAAAPADGSAGEVSASGESSTDLPTQNLDATSQVAMGQLTASLQAPDVASLPSPTDSQGWPDPPSSMHAAGRLTSGPKSSTSATAAQEKPALAANGNDGSLVLPTAAAPGVSTSGPALSSLPAASGEAGLPGSALNVAAKTGGAEASAVQSTKPLAFAARLTANATSPAVAVTSPAAAQNAAPATSLPAQPPTQSATSADLDATDQEPASSAQTAALGPDKQTAGRAAGSQDTLSAPDESTAAATKPPQPSSQTGTGSQSESGTEQQATPADQKPQQTSDTPHFDAGANPAAIPNPGTVATPAGRPAPQSPASTAPPQPPDDAPKSAGNSGPVRELALKLPASSGGSGGSASDVEIRVQQNAGQVQVTVRSSDEHLTQNLRDQLGDLVTRLDHSGYSTETWHPGGTAAAGEAVRAGAESASQNFRDNSDRQSQNGSGNDDGNSNQGNQGRRNQGNTPDWDDAIEAGLKGQNGQSQSRRAL